MPLFQQPTRPDDSQRPFYLAVAGAWLLGAELVLFATLGKGRPALLGWLGGGTFVAASGFLLFVVLRRDFANRRALAHLLHQHQEALASLSALTDATMAVLPLDRLLDDLLARLQVVLSVETAAILLLADNDTDLIVEAWRGEGTCPLKGAKVSAQDGLWSRIAASPDVAVVERGPVDDGAGLLQGLTSVAGCRIVTQNRVTGVCVVGSPRNVAFADRDVQMLQLVADRASVGIERRMMESGLREAQRMEAIGQVAGAVAHDFNNLLTVIGGYTELLDQRLDLDDGNREMLGSIRDSVGRASLLTGQLLTIGRRQTPKPVVLEPGAALRGLSEVLTRILGVDIAVRLMLDAETGNVEIDPAHFEQLILNLAINARDAMPAGGSLEIGCEPTALASENGDTGPRPFVHLTVADTGSGMDEKTRLRCFEPFFTTKDRSKGTGLGLAAVREVVLESGGRITVSSELGEGTRYDIYFPRSEEEVVAPVDAAPSPVAQGAETVLVVEDEAEVRQLICRILDRGGYQVLSAEDGPSALRLCEHWSGPIELVVSDVMMPGMRGPEVVAQLKASRPAMAVLYVSGDTDGTTDGDRAVASRAGLLAKPFKPSELSARVRNSLDESRRQAQSDSPHPELS